MRVGKISANKTVPVDRGLHSNPPEKFEDPAVSKVKLELSDVYEKNEKM